MQVCGCAMGPPPLDDDDMDLVIVLLTNQPKSALPLLLECEDSLAVVSQLRRHGALLRPRESRRGDCDRQDQSGGACNAGAVYSWRRRS